MNDNGIQALTVQPMISTFLLPYSSISTKKKPQFYVSSRIENIFELTLLFIENTVIILPDTNTSSNPDNLFEKGVELALHGSDSLNGVEYFEYVVTNLASLFSVQHVLIAIPSESSDTRLKTLCMWENDHIRESFDYESEYSPCKHIYSTKEPFIVTEKLFEQFPRNPYLKVSGMVSYFGMPLFSSENQLSGHIYLMDSSPFHPAPWKESLLKLFAKLTGPEVERYLNNRKSALNEEPEEISDTTENAVNELDTFFYKASHDIRTPIIAIEGVYNMLKSDPGLSRNPVLKLLEKQIQKIKGLNASIIEVGGIRSRMREFVPINLESLINEVLNTLHHNTSINLTIDIRPDIQVVSDTYLLPVILRNIIDNSFQYTDTNKTAPEVTISAMEDQDGITLLVKDNGTGINQHLSKKLFSMFYRADTERSGYGLGLYKAKMAADKLNIALSVDSVENEGTVVSIRF